MTVRFLLLAIVLACANYCSLANDVPATGTARRELASFDRLMTGFLAEHNLPGASLAIARQGRLVYARGYGYSDREKQERVQPDSLFRIASISKPITATAILKLVQEGRLRLDDRPFEMLKPLLQSDQTPPADPRLAQITVLQLLRHTGGWDRNQSFDPMFRSVEIAKALQVPPPAGPQHVMRHMLGVRLDFDPGERYAYSNFGYCVLGRVIEHVTQQTYEDYVRAEILKPLGISTMRIGHTRLPDRAPKEVRYYDSKERPSVFAADLGQDVPAPYGTWHLEAMDAHGGWIASATDLIKFATQFDLPTKRRLLKDESLKLLIERPAGRAGHDETGKPTETYYGLGWLVRPLANSPHCNIWHNGSLPGTSTLLVRLHQNETCWAVLINSRETTPEPSAKLDRLLHEAAGEVKQWPVGQVIAR